MKHKHRRCATYFARNRRVLQLTAALGLLAWHPVKAGTYRHTISVLVENKLGVLDARGRAVQRPGYNIDSLNGRPTADSTTSRMTLSRAATDATVDQIVKQLNKLVNVINVHDFREGESVDRDWLW